MTTEPTHPQAPTPGTDEEGPGETTNDTRSVLMRGGIEIGAMRYVLGGGIIIAVIAMVAAALIAR